MPGDIEIVPEGSGFVVRLDGHDQSHVDLDDPTHVVFDYVRRMADVVDAQGPAGRPVRVLHIGGAGLTLPRYVATTRPRSPQVVLEPHVALTEAVRLELPMPRTSGVKVRPVDGRTGLRAVRDASYDVVVLDAYAEGRVPADLVTLQAAHEVARVLGPGGLFLLNLADRAPFDWTRRVVAGVRTVLPVLMISAEPATLRARRGGNLLLVASAEAVPLAALRERATRSAAPYRVLDAAAVSDSFGGGAPFVDGATEPSPAP